MWLHKKSQGKSLLNFRMAQSLQDETVAVLNAKNMTYVRRPHSFRLTVDKETTEKNAELFSSVATLIKKSWESGGA